jgi:hypothetical protein
MFTPTQLLRRWREQRPSNKDDLHTSITGEILRGYCTGIDLLLIFFAVVRAYFWVAL